MMETKESFGVTSGGEESLGNWWGWVTEISIREIYTL